MISRRVLTLASAALICGVGGVAEAEVAAADARKVFAQAEALCRADDGRLWGVPLCGPILLVDYTDKKVVANQPDAAGLLKPSGSLYVGKVADDFVIANTTTDWAGVRWTQLVFPFHFDDTQRPVTLAHEMFHRVQAPLGLTRPEKANGHLDTLEGRYLIQLEWRALAAALHAQTAEAKRDAAADAMLFRRERYRLFPTAASEEAALEISEGVPEYTGVMVGLPSPRQRIDYAVRDLSAFVGSPTFVRAFAYASGPAMGLLLDEYAPGWRRRLGDGKSLDALLVESGALPNRALSEAAARTATYDRDGALRRFEVDREAKRQARLTELRARLIDGPVVIVPTSGSRYQFNPQTLIALDHGTVYPTVQVVAQWGVLEVKSGGAFFDRSAKQLRVSAAGAAPDHLSGDGWSLQLKPGWRISGGPRSGDLVVEPASSP
ncbi:MAG: hypothetical protein ABW063_12760 [Caulobacter sp.]